MSRYADETPEERKERLRKRAERRARVRGKEPPPQAIGTVIEGAFGTEADAQPQREKVHKAPRKKVKMARSVSAVLDGEINIEDLTVEELVRGQIKGKDGQFHRPPNFVPREFHQRCMRELLKRGDALFRESYLDAIQVLVDIAKNPELDEGARIRAANMVIERVAGKTPEKIEVAVTDPWQSLVEGIVAEVEDEKIARAQEVLSDKE